MKRYVYATCALCIALTPSLDGTKKRRRGGKKIRPAAERRRGKNDNVSTSHQPAPQNSQKGENVTGTSPLSGSGKHQRGRPKGQPYKKKNNVAPQNPPQSTSQQQQQKNTLRFDDVLKIAQGKKQPSLDNKKQAIKLEGDLQSFLQKQHPEASSLTRDQLYTKYTTTIEKMLQDLEKTKQTAILGAVRTKLRETTPFGPLEQIDLHNLAEHSKRTQRIPFSEFLRKVHKGEKIGHKEPAIIAGLPVTHQKNITPKTQEIVKAAIETTLKKLHTQYGKKHAKVRLFEDYLESNAKDLNKLLPSSNQVETLKHQYLNIGQFARSLLNQNQPEITITPNTKLIGEPESLKEAMKVKDLSSAIGKIHKQLQQETHDKINTKKNAQPLEIFRTYLKNNEKAIAQHLPDKAKIVDGNIVTYLNQGMYDFNTFYNALIGKEDAQAIYIDSNTQIVLPKGEEFSDIEHKIADASEGVNLLAKGKHTTAKLNFAKPNDVQTAFARFLDSASQVQ